ncbi:hypothetical protein Pelo_9609 [Pelomyxa schiedti]|nr:hypothetical protein Pelo_9609 [Pelomyxa schiedti]
MPTTSTTTSVFVDGTNQNGGQTQLTQPSQPSTLPLLGSMQSILVDEAESQDEFEEEFIRRVDYGAHQAALDDIDTEDDEGNYSSDDGSNVDPAPVTRPQSNHRRSNATPEDDEERNAWGDTVDHTQFSNPKVQGGHPQVFPEQYHSLVGFHEHFDPLMEHIWEQTNAKLTREQRCFNQVDIPYILTKEKLVIYFAIFFAQGYQNNLLLINFYTSLVKVENCADYWSDNPLYKNEWMRNLMSWKEWCFIHRHLQANLGYVVDLIETLAEKLWVPATYIAIDDDLWGWAVALK